jgi:magnesium transporter
MRKFLVCDRGFTEKDNWSNGSWVNVTCPDADDFKFLTEALEIPESFLSDISDPDERPRTDFEDEWLLAIIRIPVVSNTKETPFITVPLGVISRKDTIVSVCYYDSEMIPDFINYSQRKSLIIRNESDLILRFLLSSAVWFLKYLKQINNQVISAQKEFNNSIRNEDLVSLMKLDQSLVFFNTSIRGNEIMTSKLRTIFREKDYLDLDLMEDVETEIRQAHNTVNIYTDILNGTMEALGSIVSNNVNTIMKRMTSVSLILMIPTLIASLYGMNVRNHFEDLPHSFIGICLFSLGISALAFIILKKIKWF